jgi:serine/threonine-protein kinase RsbW
MRPRLDRTLPAVPESVTAMRHAISEFAAAAGATSRVLDDVRLAVTEAVSNVVVHAYAGAAEPGAVWVAAVHCRDDTLHVVVSDEGRGMVPRLDSPGLGLGLPLIAQTCSTLDVQRAAQGGTELRMSFGLAG